MSYIPRTRSFDDLYGLFPGANGILQAKPEQYIQVDNDGKPLPTLPPVWNEGKACKEGKAKEHDPAFPTGLPNKPFQLDAPPVNLTASQPTCHLVHRYYQSTEQVNNGKNNRFAAISDCRRTGDGILRRVETADVEVGEGVHLLADNFFMGAFGGSYLNHFWMVCACAPQDPTAPKDKDQMLESLISPKFSPKSTDKDTLSGARFPTFRYGWTASILRRLSDARWLLC